MKRLIDDMVFFAGRDVRHRRVRRQERRALARGRWLFLGVPQRVYCHKRQPRPNAAEAYCMREGERLSVGKHAHQKRNGGADVLDEAQKR